MTSELMTVGMWLLVVMTGIIGFLLAQYKAALDKTIQEFKDIQAAQTLMVHGIDKRLTIMEERDHIRQLQTKINT